MEHLPKIILSYTATFIAGFVAALWCLPLIETKPQTAIQKTGFSISVPESQIKDTQKLYELRGKAIRLVRQNGNDIEPCIIDHIPLNLSLSGHFIQLSGPISSLENFVIHVSAGDFKQFDVVDVESNQSMPSCRLHPKVSYGD
jgi:hypothetical protein